jgi:hypothetical protein
MIESMKIIRIPNLKRQRIKIPKHLDFELKTEEFKIFNAKERQTSLNNLTNMTHFDQKPPPLKVRQLPMKSIEFKPRLEFQKSSSPQGLISTRLALSTSFKKKRDSTYIKQSKINETSETDTSKPIPQAAQGKTLTSYKHLTRNKYLLSSTRIPTSDNHSCLLKSHEDQGILQKFRLTSYLRSLKSKIP